MTKYTWLLYAVLTLLGASCKDHFEEAHGDPIFLNNIRFDHPEMGQVSQYLRFYGPSCPDSDPPFAYLADTLVLEVTAVSGDLITCTERLTPGSACVKTADPSDDPHGIGTQELICQFQVSNGVAKLVSSSYFNLQTRLVRDPDLVMPLAPISGPECSLQEWYPVESNLSEQGYLANYFQLGILYDRLNVVTNYGPMAFDGAGHLCFFSAESGMVRTGYRSGWCQRGEGWDLLPE